MTLKVPLGLCLKANKVARRKLCITCHSRTSTCHPLARQLQENKSAGSQDKSGKNVSTALGTVTCSKRGRDDDKVGCCRKPRWGLGCDFSHGPRPIHPNINFPVLETSYLLRISPKSAGTVILEVPDRRHRQSFGHSVGLAGLRERCLKATNTITILHMFLNQTKKQHCTHFECIQRPTYIFFERFLWTFEDGYESFESKGL